jgi:hypothetical protein
VKAGTSSRHLRLVFDQFAATACEDWRSTSEACAVLLAVLAEGHLTRTRFAAIIRRIALLPLPANGSAGGVEDNPDDRRRGEEEVSKKLATRAPYEAGQARTVANRRAFVPKR